MKKQEALLLLGLFIVMVFFMITGTFAVFYASHQVQKMCIFSRIIVSFNPSPNMAHAIVTLKLKYINILINCFAMPGSCGLHSSIYRIVMQLILYWLKCNKNVRIILLHFSVSRNAIDRISIPAKGQLIRIIVLNCNGTSGILIAQTGWRVGGGDLNCTL